MAIEISRSRFPSIEKFSSRILASLSREQTQPVTFVEPDEKPKEPLALTPIAQPEGTARMFYNLAYVEGNESHPLHGFSEALLVNGGVISAEDAVVFQELDTDISMVSQTEPDGSVTSEVVLAAYRKQAIENTVYTAPQSHPGENLDLKALQVVSMAAD